MSVWRRHLAIGKATTKGTGSIKHAGFRAYFVTSSSFCQKELLLLRLLFFPERTRLIDFFFAPWPVPHSSCMFYILFFFCWFEIRKRRECYLLVVTQQRVYGVNGMWKMICHRYFCKSFFLEKEERAGSVRHAPSISARLSICCTRSLLPSSYIWLYCPL